MNVFLAKLYVEIINPVITLLFAVAFLVFFWGIFNFIRAYGDDEQRNNGKRHMLYGVIGLFVMVAVFGIMHMIAGTFGLDSTLIPI